MSTTPGADMADTMIADSAERLFAGQVDRDMRLRTEAGELDAGLWQHVADSGFALLLASPAAGGFELGWAAAYPVLRGLGYWQVPLPLAETMVAAQLASLAGFELPAGPLTLIEQGRGNQLQTEGGPGATTLSGVAHAVPWARHAEAALVSLADGRLALLGLRQNPGVTVQPQVNHAGLPSDTLQLQKARPISVADNPLALQQPVWTLGAVARSAMLVGALESALEQSVRYAGERVQFGKPIGRNQAIQQNLALMAGDVAAARVAAMVAAADAPGAASDTCAATPFQYAVAKVRASRPPPGDLDRPPGARRDRLHQEHALHFPPPALGLA
ncbi:MAG: acyl-CoA dehydrogenase family protein [Burkholderiaceae bacterium]